jgi:hypothetical protein
LIPVYFLARDFDFRGKIHVLLLAALLPFVLSGCHYLAFRSSWIWDHKMIPGILYFVLGYRHLYCLLALFLFMRKSQTGAGLRRNRNMLRISASHCA